MKILKFAVLLVALMTVGVGGKSYAHDIEVANADGVTIYYNYINNRTELAVTYKGSSSFSNAYAGKVVIPKSVTRDGNTYSVTSIGMQAFEECTGLTEVTIPNSVTSIGDGAFSYCGLTELTIPNSVTSIGDEAFYYCDGLEKITVESGNPKYDSRENCNAIIHTSSNGLIAGCKNTIIPNSVTSIGYGAFAGCSLPTELAIPNSVTYIGDYAFSHCYGLTKVTIPGSVTYIGWKAFEDCIGLTEVTIGNSVTSIGEAAFENCSGLTEVTIPNSVTSIGEAIFWGCSGLEKITVESGNPKYDSRENCNAIITTNGNELIAGCKNTKIPNSVTSIGDWAFHCCDGLTELTIPNSVTSIGYGAFEGCSGLTELTIPNSVTSIGDEAFYYCDGLTEVTIGNSVTYIGEYAFWDCYGLTTLYSLNTTPPSADIYVFNSNHYTNVDVFVPQEALAAYQNAEVWKEFKKLQGIEYSSVKGVSAAEQIQTANGQVTVTGLTDGTTVTVYDLSGQQVGSAVSKGGQVSISVGLTSSAAAIVKIGEKSVKVIMK